MEDTGYNRLVYSRTQPCLVYSKGVPNGEDFPYLRLAVLGKIKIAFQRVHVTTMVGTPPTLGVPGKSIEAHVKPLVSEQSGAYPVMPCMPVGAVRQARFVPVSPGRLGPRNDEAELVVVPCPGRRLLISSSHFERSVILRCSRRRGVG